MRLVGALISAVSLLTPLTALFPRTEQISAEARAAPNGFLENAGQFDADVLFSAGFPGGVLWITGDSLWYSLASGVNVRLEFLNSLPNPAIEKSGLLPIRTSFFTGATPDDWRTDIPTWSEVRLAGLYPGVDLAFTNESGIPVARFREQSRGPTQPDSPIRLRLSGAQIEAGAQPVLSETEISGKGYPILTLATEVGKDRIPLPGGSVGWFLEAEDTGGAERSLAIAPVAEVRDGLGISERPTSSPAIIYSSYVGWEPWDQADGVGFDSEGRIYLAGYTFTFTFPQKPGLESNLHNADAFVVSLDPSVGGAAYLAIFTGADLLNGEEYISDLVVTADGSAYVVGRTNSLDFPTTPGAYDSTPNGGFDSFAMKLDPLGNLVYSTYLGGDGLDFGTGIALAGDGSAFLTGGNFSTNFPVSLDALYPATAGSRDVFVSHLSPDGGSLLYSTYYGGETQDQAEDIDLGTDGSLYLTGWTRSPDFPVSPEAFDTEFNPPVDPDPPAFDSFIVRMTPNNQPVVYASYLGGTGEDRGFGIQALPDGRAVTAGSSNSTDFPVTSDASQVLLGGGSCPGLSPPVCPDAFYAAISPDGASLDHGTYLGGDGWDAALGLTDTADGSVILTGDTYAVDFPVTLGALDLSLDGERDAFIARFETPAQDLTYASYLGGGDSDEGFAVASSPSGAIYLAGRTLSSDFPTTPNAYSTKKAGDYDAFGMIMELPEALYIYLPAVLRIAE